MPKSGDFGYGDFGYGFGYGHGDFGYRATFLFGESEAQTTPCSGVLSAKY